MEKRYLTIDEATEYLNVSKSTARRVLNQIGAKKNIASRTVRYDMEVIKEVLDGKEN